MYNDIARTNLRQRGLTEAEDSMADLLELTSLERLLFIANNIYLFNKTTYLIEEESPLVSILCLR
jgi:hypothetical protein